MNGNFCSIVKKLDILGPTIGLEISNSYRFRSVPGGIFSFLIIAGSLVISTLFGTEIFVRKHPAVSYSEEYIENSLIKLQEIPIYFDFTFSNGSAVEDYTRLFETLFVIQSVDDTNKATQDSFSLSMEQCKFERFNSVYQPLFESIKNQTNRFFCSNFNSSAYVLNEKTTKNSREIRTIFNRCRNNCLPNTSLLIGINYISSYIDITDLENPVKYSIERNSVLLSSGLQKINFYQFSRNIIQSDEGWILEAKNNLEFISPSPIEADIVLTDGLPGSSVYAAIIHSKRYRTNISRSYMKIQELAAKVGGFVNLIIISLNILAGHYLRFHYLIHIFSSLKKNQECTSSFELKQNNNPLKDSNMQAKFSMQERESNPVKVHKYNNDSFMELQSSIKLNKLPDQSKETYLNYLVSIVCCSLKKSLISKSLSVSKRALEFENYNKIYYNLIFKTTMKDKHSIPI